jgi:putative flippase GtrA
MLKKYIVFIVGGGLGALLAMSVTYSLTEFFGFWYLSSYMIGGALNILFNFFYQRRITFGISDKIRIRLMKFFLVSIVVSLLIIQLIYIFTEVAGIWYIYSGVIAISIVSIINFSLNNFWVFSNDKKVLEGQSR